MSVQLRTLSGRLGQGLDTGRVTSGTVGSFAKLFDRVSTLNFEGTQVFRDAMADVRELLGGVTAEELRASGGLRGNLKEQMAAFTGRFEALKGALREAHPEPLFAQSA